MLTPPPSSTLFPYTTLFRSKSPSTTKPGSITDNFRNFRDCHFQKTSRASAKGATREPYESANNLHSAQRDRKSTRLNSSHVSISYAVFCLKKKHTTITL